MRKLDWSLLGFVVALILFALIKEKTPSGNQEIFSGADGQAEKVITEINPSYKPWWEPLWEPPSGEIESLLFALQAAIGAGFIGYFLGGKVAMKRARKQG